MTRPATQLRSLALIPLVVAWSLCAMYGNDSSKGVPFDEKLKAKVMEGDPELAIIGNSMVSQRMDLKALRRECRPLQLSTLAVGGSECLHWYFAFKNIFAASTPPPKLVCLVFRDFDFTEVAAESSGPQMRRIRALMRPDDAPVLATAQSKGQMPGWKRWIFDHFVAPNRLAERHNTNAAQLVGALSGSNDERVLEQANLLFSPVNLRSDTLDAGGQRNASLVSRELDFTTDDADSLLGKFLTIARERQIKLVFYRVKRRPDHADGVTRVQSAGMRAYMKTFAQWAQANGCGFIDETDDPAITESQFQDGDHLAEEHYLANAKRFLARLRPYFPTVAP